MKFTRILQSAAVGGSLLVLAGSEAQAAFMYTTFITLTDAPRVGPDSPVSRSFGAGSTLTMEGTSQSGLAGTQGINIANVHLTSTTLAPPTDTAIVAYSIDVHILIPAPGGLSGGTLTIMGLLKFLRSDAGGQLSTNQFISSARTDIGATIFTINPAIGGAYAQPTVNTVPGVGNISVVLGVVTIPEPASLMLLGLSAVGLSVFFRRRITRGNALIASA